MSRGLTASVESHLEGAVVSPVVFIEMDFPSGTVRLFTGQGQISWNSQTWDGTGELISVGNISETMDGSAQGTEIVATGIDSDLISDVTEDDWQNSDVTIWIGFYDASKNVIASAKRMFYGFMDTGEIVDNGETATIKINAESKLINQLRRIQYRYTDQDQRKLHPGDTGFRHLARIQDKQIVWKG